MTKDLEAHNKASYSSDQKQSPTDTEVQDALAILKGRSRAVDSPSQRRLKQRPRSLIIYNPSVSLSAFDNSAGQYTGPDLLINTENPRPKLGIGASILSRQSKKSDNSWQESEDFTNAAALTGSPQERSNDDMHRVQRSSSQEAKFARSGKIVSTL